MRFVLYVRMNIGQRLEEEHSRLSFDLIPSVRLSCLLTNQHAPLHRKR